MMIRHSMINLVRKTHLQPFVGSAVIAAPIGRRATSEDSPENQLQSHMHQHCRLVKRHVHGLISPDNCLAVCTIGTRDDLGSDSKHDARDSRRDTREHLAGNHSLHAAGCHGYDGTDSEDDPRGENHVASTVDITNDGEDGTKSDGRDCTSLNNPDALTRGAVQSTGYGVLLGKCVSKSDVRCLLNILTFAAGAIP